MKYIFSYLLLIFAVLIFSQNLIAQDLEARSDITKDLPSTATDINNQDFNFSKSTNFPRTKIYIIVKNPDKVLYGNPCMEEITRDMGFQYLLIPKTNAEGYSRKGAAFHNLGSHVKLIFKNGPFYKRKLRRAIKFCRQMSGEFVAYNSGYVPE